MLFLLDEPMYIYYEDYELFNADKQVRRCAKEIGSYEYGDIEQVYQDINDVKAS